MNLNHPLTYVTRPSTGYVNLGKIGLLFETQDVSTAEKLCTQHGVAARRGLRQYIANQLKIYHELLWRFIEDGLTFEYTIEQSCQFEVGAVVTISVWLEPARISWDLVALSA